MVARRLGRRSTGRACRAHRPRPAAYLSACQPSRRGGCGNRHRTVHFVPPQRLLAEPGFGQSSPPTPVVIAFPGPLDGGHPDGPVAPGFIARKASISPWWMSSNIRGRTTGSSAMRPAGGLIGASSPHVKHRGDRLAYRVDHPVEVRRDERVRRECVARPDLAIFNTEVGERRPIV